MKVRMLQVCCIRLIFFYLVVPNKLNMIYLPVTPPCLSGRYAMQAMKQMEPQMKQALQSFPTTVSRKQAHTCKY